MGPVQERELRRLLRFVGKNPGITSREISPRLRMSKPKVARFVSIARKEGRISPPFRGYLLLRSEPSWSIERAVLPIDDDWLDLIELLEREEGVVAISDAQSELHWDAARFSREVRRMREAGILAADGALFISE
jgi:DNA-binding Lrp family transcriptional regulator